MMADSIVNYIGSGRYTEGSWGYTILRTIYSDESNKLWPVGSVNEELGRRFILEEVDVDSEKLNIPDLDKASQDDIKALTNVFDSWLRSAVGDVENNDVFNVQHSARFHDFLSHRRGLTPLDRCTSQGDVAVRTSKSRGETSSNHSLLRLGGESDGGEYGHNYDGWMKLCTDDIPETWFERVRAFGKSVQTFERREMPDGSEMFWYYGS
ncbi:hypothetical protein V498_09306 [Pseudogymnoascus sp. VKM F-4517 (FW-2822)]|nr:hypothetical protein V498_09306 [Pseudogymnoascus sp. VKM F-4517 (FW-2822)]